MRKLRTLDEVTEGYFREHPEEIDDYLTEIFQDFAEDNDTGVLLASLRIILNYCDYLLYEMPTSHSDRNINNIRSTQ